MINYSFLGAFFNCRLNRAVSQQLLCYGMKNIFVKCSNMSPSWKNLLKSKANFRKTLFVCFKTLRKQFHSLFRKVLTSGPKENCFCHAHTREILIFLYLANAKSKSYMYEAQTVNKISMQVLQSKNS